VRSLFRCDRQRCHMLPIPKLHIVDRGLFETPYGRIGAWRLARGGRGASPRLDHPIVAIEFAVPCIELGAGVQLLPPVDALSDLPVGSGRAQAGHRGL